MMPIHIGPPSADQIMAAAALANDALGDGYLDAGDLRDLSPNDHCRLAVRNRSVIGLVLARRDSGAGILQGAPDGVADVVAAAIPDLADAGAVGQIRTIVVHPDVRGHGVGGLLLDGALRWIDAHTVDLTCAWAWWDGPVCHSLSLLRSRDFARVATIDDFWHADSVAQAYACPRCGTPCRCRASIMVRPA